MQDRKPPPDLGTPRGNLAHTVEMYADEPDDWMVLLATSNYYGDGVRTGLTMGDLREIASQLAEVTS